MTANPPIFSAVPVHLPGRTGGAKRALITGIRGFAGHYLAIELAAAGYQVFGTAHGSEPLSDQIFAVDVTDRVGLTALVTRVQPDVVAHLAAISFVAHGDPEEIYRTNLIGTRNLLQALVESACQPQAVLLASSANVYGNATTELINESMLPAPANDYAVSKLAMEQMAGLWSDRLPIIIARPFNYTGVGQSDNFLVPKIVTHFRQRAPEIELGNLDIAREFLDVRAVVAAYRRLIETASTTAGSTFNICNGVAYTLDEVIETASDIAGYRIVVKVNPAFSRPNEIKRLVGSNTKLMSAVGSLPNFTLSETLRWMFGHHA